MRIIHDRWMNGAITESNIEKMRTLESLAVDTFELFQKEVCRLLVISSSNDFALIYVDFSKVMLRRAEFESSYQFVMSDLKILAEQQKKASAITSFAQSIIMSDSKILAELQSEASTIMSFVQPSMNDLEIVVEQLEKNPIVILKESNILDID